MTVTNQQVNKFLGLPEDFDPTNPNASEGTVFTKDQLGLLAWYETMMDNGHPVCTIAGSAGSGKTFMVQTMIQRAKNVNPNYRIAVAAPTNKAVRILADKLKAFNLDYSIYNDDGKSYDPNRVYIGTVHKFLKAVPNTTELETDEEDLEFALGDKEERPISRMDIVFIDECSMISKEFFELIKESVEGTVFFVGDPYQLFPVIPNSPEAYKISPTFEVENIYRLSEVVRYDGEILKIATALRNKMEDEIYTRPYSFKPYNQDDIKVIKNKNGYQGTAWYEMLLDHAKQQYNKDLHPDFVRSLVYKRRTREILNNQLRSDLYGQSAINSFVTGEWLFTHSVCSNYIPLDLRVALIRAAEDNDPGYGDLSQKIKDELIRIGNARDIQVGESRVIQVPLVSPTSDLDDQWTTLNQNVSLITADTPQGLTEIAILTEDQLKQFAANKQTIVQMLSTMGYTSTSVMKYLKQLSYCFNVTETNVKYVPEHEKDLIYHNLGYGNYSSKVKVGSKIQSGLVLTVHQSQGSTIDHAYAVYNDYFTKHDDVDPQDSMSLLYRLLYVALTRAKKSAVVFSKY